MNYKLFIAFKHLAKRRRTGFVSLITLISVSGVAVGVMALIVVMAVMSGFDSEFKSKIVGMNPHLIIQKPGGIENYNELADVIHALDPQFVSVSPFTQGQVIIRSNTNAIGAIAKGISPERSKRGVLSFASEFIKEGDLSFQDVRLEDEMVGSVAIGTGLARVLNVRAGDTVYLISPHFDKKKGGLKSRTAKTLTVQVSGIFELGMNEFDTTLILLNLERSSELFNMKERVGGLSARLQDVDQSELVKQRLIQGLGPAYLVQSWQDLNRSFFSALKVEKAVMRILLALIVTVAAFNIISTLIMVIMEKQKEIGILRALGATRAGVKMIFLIEGFCIGALGTVAGGLLGFFLAKNINGVAAIVERITGFEVFPKDIYYFSEIPVQINSHDVGFIILFALLMAVGAGLFPAHQAGKVSPVEAIRYE